MDESNAFTKRHVEEVTAAKRTLLDELNLPPKIKKYLRDNALFLQLSFIFIIAAICVWNYYSYYKTTQNDQAAQQLSQAMLMTDVVQRTAALGKIPIDFSSAGSSRWSQLALAGDYLRQKEYPQAISILQALNKDVDRDNPLFPLLQQFSGVAYELNGEFESALSHYKTLTTLPGFEALGYIESGRIYELQGMAGEAKDVYEKANSANDLKPDQRTWVEEKMNSL
jgi:predicted negative regulator of RcsB-dependent stress response